MDDIREVERLRSERDAAVMAAERRNDLILALESENAALLRRAEAAEAGQDDVVAAVVERANRYSEKWQDETGDYWFARLVQEVGELGSVLVGDHDDTDVHELEQIASIAISWLRKIQRWNNDVGEARLLDDARASAVPVGTTGEEKKDG